MSGEMVSRPVGLHPGFCGKLPARGDFVSRRLPRSFIDPWDAWLQAGLARSRDQLLDAWLDAYLTSPIWRFGLGAGVCGESTWLGILMPSVDGVGRHFPLTIAAELPKELNLIRALLDSGSWFARAEQLALSCLDDDFDFDSFENEIAVTGLPAIEHGSSAGWQDEPLGRECPETSAWHYRVSAGFDAVLPELAENLLSGARLHYSLWLTSGSDQIGPSFLLCERLPPVMGFAALLDGRWVERGWSQDPSPKRQPLKSTS